MKPTESGGQATWRAGVWLTTASIVPLVAGAGLSVVLGRLLGPSGLGVQSYIAYVQALLSALLVGSLFSLWIRQIASAHGAGDEELAARLARQSAVTSMVGGGISVVILVGFGLRSTEPVAWFACAAWAVANAATLNYGSRTIAKYGYEIIARQNLFWQTLAPVLAVGAAVAGWNVTGVFIAYALAETGLALANRRRAPRVGRGPWLPLQREVLRLALAYETQAILNEIVFRRIEFFFLAFWTSTTQIAMYSVAFMVISTAMLLPSSIIGATFPAMAKAIGAHGHSGMSEHLLPAARIIIVASPPFVAILATLAPPFVVRLYGEAFQDAAHIIPLMSATCLLLPLATLCQAYWSARGLLRPATITMIIAAVVDLSLCLTVIKPWGIWGSATSTTSAQVAFSVILIGYTWLKMSRRPRPPIQLLVSVCASAAIAAFNIWALRLHAGFSGIAAWMLVDLLALFAIHKGIGLLRRSDEDWLVDLLPDGLQRRLAPLRRL